MYGTSFWHQLPFRPIDEVNPPSLAPETPKKTPQVGWLRSRWQKQPAPVKAPEIRGLMTRIVQGQQNGVIYL